jgi:hypothetical protein
MFGKSRRRPSAAMVVAIAALVVAMTGSAIAGPIKALINGSSIKKHSIAGNRLANHTLTGAQINLKKLGTVPSAKQAARAKNATNATNATTAANALALGGQPAASYFSASKLLRWNFTMNKGNPAHTFTYGPLTFAATCQADGGNTNAELAVTTSESGTYVSREPDAEPGGGTILNSGGTPFDITSMDTSMVEDGNSAEFEAFDPNGQIAIFSTAQTIGVAINTPGADCRFFGSLLNDA